MATKGEAEPRGGTYSGQDGSHRDADRFFDRLVGQSGVILTSRAFGYVLGFVASILLARILGAESLGRFQLGLVTMNMVSIFCVMGLDKGLVKFISVWTLRESGQVRWLIVFSLIAGTVVASLFSALLYAMAPRLASSYFQSPAMGRVLRIFCLFLPAFVLFRIASGAIIGLKRADLESLIRNLVLPAAFVAALLAVMLFQYQLTASIIAKTAAQSLAAVCLAAAAFRLLPPNPVPRQSPKLRQWLKPLFSFSTPLLLIGLVYLLLGQMDILMLGYFVDDRAVGIYSVAAKLALFVILGLEIVLPISGPTFSDLAEKKELGIIERLYKSTTKWIFYAALAVFSGLILLSDQVLSLFGTSFAAGVTVLAILALGQVANALSGPCGQLLVMTGHQRWELSNTLAMLAVNFALNLLLIPRMGTTGAAVATACSIAAINAIKVIQVYYLFSIHPYSARYLKGLISVSGAAAAGYLLRNLMIYLESPVVVLMAAVGLGFATVMLTGLLLFGMDAEDHQLRQAVMRRAE